VSYSQNCDCEYVPPSADDPDDDKMYTTVHRAGSTYYPHYLPRSIYMHRVSAIFAEVKTAHGRLSRNSSASLTLR
jgi:hypothetical protein